MENSICFILIFSCIFKMHLLIVNSVEKEHLGVFHLLQIASQWGGLQTAEALVTSARTVTRRNFCACAKLKKNSPNWCSWGPSGSHQMNPSNRCAKQASSAIGNWCINSRSVILDWLYLSPPEALQYRFLLLLLSYFAICLFLHAIRVRDEWRTPDTMKYCWSAFDFQTAKLFLLTLVKARLSYV